MSKEVKEQEEKVMEESQAPVEEAKEEKAPAKKVEADKKKDLDPKKIEKDVSCSAMFEVGEEVELKKLPFVVKEVRGIDIVLKRKDIQ